MVLLSQLLNLFTVDDVDIEVVVVSITLLFTDSDRFITPADDVIIIIMAEKKQFIICNQNENIMLKQDPTAWYIGLSESQTKLKLNNT